MREVYGNKGIFVLPKFTDKGIALGSVTCVLVAVLAVIINVALIPQGLTYPLAASFGLGWGIAATDIVANMMGRLKQ